MLKKLSTDTKPEDSIPDLFTESSKQLAEKGIYLIDKEISNENLIDTYQDILLKKINKWEGSITLIVNSPGGSATATWSFIDLLKNTPYQILTVGTGEICSGGAMIFAAGTKGCRKLTRNASILIHEARVATDENTMLQHRAQMKGMEQEHKRHIRFWLEVSTLKTEQRVKKFFLNKEDNYFTPEECLSFGIADQIL